MKEKAIMKRPVGITMKAEIDILMAIDNVRLKSGKTKATHRKGLILRSSDISKGKYGALHWKDVSLVTKFWMHQEVIHIGKG